MTQHGCPHHCSTVSTGSDVWPRGVKKQKIKSKGITQKLNPYPLPAADFSMACESFRIFFFPDMKKESYPPDRVSKL